MKRDPVVILVGLLALIQVLALSKTVIPTHPEKSRFHAVAPEMVKLGPPGEEKAVVYIRCDLLHRQASYLAGANIMVLGFAALYRWRKFGKPDAGPLERT